jgi:hypothetical protein
MVQQQSAFSFRKILSAFTKQEVTLTHVAKDGSQTLMMLADHIEAERNADIRCADLVLRFDTVLVMCMEIAKHFRKMVAATYQLLLNCLRSVRDVQTEGQPPFQS